MKIKILIILLAIIFCLIIYKVTYKNSNYILALGDSSCLAQSINGAKTHSYNYYLGKYLRSRLNDNFCKKNLKVSELNAIIINNKNQILKDLDKANYVTLMIGYDELLAYKNVSNEVKKDFLINYDELLNNIMINTKAKVIVIGFYWDFFNNSDEINRKIKNAVYNYNAIFLDASDLLIDKRNFYDVNYFNLTELGNKNLFEIIKQKL